MMLGLGAASAISYFGAKHFNTATAIVAPTAGGSFIFAATTGLVVLAMELWKRRKVRPEVNQKLDTNNAIEHNSNIDWSKLSEEDKREILSLVELNGAVICSITARVFIAAGLAFGMFNYLNENIHIDTSSISQVAANTGFVTLSATGAFNLLTEQLGIPTSRSGLTGITVAFASLLLAPSFTKYLGDWFANAVSHSDDEEEKQELSNAASSIITAVIATTTYAVARASYGGAFWKRNMRVIEDGRKPQGLIENTTSTASYLWNKFTSVCTRCSGYRETSNNVNTSKSEITPQPT